MAEIVRLRTGIDERSGRPLRGAQHLRQSLAHIWRTRTNSIPMLLGYGSDLRSFLAEDITQALALEIYDELVTTAHRWEPEARLTDLQLVHLTSIGALGLEYTGTYYPEGRFGNYALSTPLNASHEFVARERFARAVA